MPPNDNDCRAGRAVKFNSPTVVSWGKDNSDNTVSWPSSKPPMDLRLENDKLDSCAAFVTVKLPVIF